MSPRLGGLSRGEAPLLTGPLRTSVGAGHAARPEASNVSRDGVLLRCLHCSFGLGFALPGVAASPRGSSATEGPVEGVQALGLAHSAAIPAWPRLARSSASRERLTVCALRDAAPPAPPSVRGNGMPLSRLQWRKRRCGDAPAPRGVAMAPIAARFTRLVATSYQIT